MSAATALLTELETKGVLLVVDGDDLDIDAPPDVLTAELIAMLKMHKPELMTKLATNTGQMMTPMVDDALPTKSIVEGGLAERIIECDRCGCREFVDVAIHDGLSVRRDCARCQRFIEFPKWNGKDTGQIVQQPIEYQHGEETIPEADRPIAASNRRLRADAV